MHKLLQLDRKLNRFGKGGGVGVLGSKSITEKHFPQFFVCLAADCVIVIFPGDVKEGEVRCIERANQEWRRRGEPTVCYRHHHHHHHHHHRHHHYLHRHHHHNHHNHHLLHLHHHVQCVFFCEHRHSTGTGRVSRCIWITEESVRLFSKLVIQAV